MCYVEEAPNRSELTTNTACRFRRIEAAIWKMVRTFTQVHTQLNTVSCTNLSSVFNTIFLGSPSSSRSHGSSPSTTPHSLYHSAAHSPKTPTGPFSFY